MAADLEADHQQRAGWLWLAERREGTTIIVELGGEWDLAATPAASRATAAACEARPERLVVDLTALTFIDASGLHAIVELARRAEEDGVRLVVIIGCRAVWRPFELCGLTERLPLIPPRPGWPAAGRPGRKPARTDGRSPAGRIARALRDRHPGPVPPPAAPRRPVRRRSNG